MSSFLKITLWGFVFLFNTVAHSQIEIDTISIQSDSNTLVGTLCCPSSKNKIPLVLIIAGSGPTDRNGNQAPYIQCDSYKKIAEALAKKGIASFRYDKRGIGASKDSSLDESKLLFTDYVHDAEAWVNRFNQDGRFSEICIAGHSEGSLIGMLASKNTNVSKYISLSGSGFPIATILKKQLNIIKDKAISREIDTILAKLQRGEHVDSIPKMLTSIFRPSVQNYLISWFQFDPAKEIAALKIPVLILQGKNDIQVDPSNAEELKKGNPNAKLLIIKGMNHILKNSSLDRAANIATYTNPGLPLNKELVKALVQFLKPNKNAERR